MWGYSLRLENIDVVYFKIGGVQRVALKKYKPNECGSNINTNEERSVCIFKRKLSINAEKVLADCRGSKPKQIDESGIRLSIHSIVRGSKNSISLFDAQQYPNHGCTNYAIS